MHLEVQRIETCLTATPITTVTLLLLPLYSDSNKSSVSHFLIILKNSPFN